MNTASFAGAGEMGDRVAALDWASTPIGPMSRWSNSLVTAVGICLRSRFPIVLWWGPELTVIYNDAYRSVAGNKHPGILGVSGREAWAEIWDTIGPRLQRVLERGEASWSDDEMLLIRRHSFLEEGYFTFSYSPIADDDRSIGGVFCAVTETTSRVIGERRLRTLRDLAAASVRARTTEEACRLLAEVMAQNHADLPFALLYLVDERASTATLVAKTAEWLDAETAPPTVDLRAASDRWGLDQLWRSGEAVELHDLRWPVPPGLAAERTPTTALVLPVRQPGSGVPAGMLVAGVSPLRELDDKYLSFLQLLAGQVATAIAAARAQEAERRRVEALAELDRAKTAFFSNVSHEFRTPLTLILGPLAALAADPALSGEQRAQAEMARRNALRMLKLTNALLDFSRLQAGRLRARFEPTDLAAATAALASSFAFVTAEAGLELVVRCPGLPTTVHVDRHLWETVVLNLLSNAFKYTHEGRIAVEVRDAGDHAELVVRDTGIGIPEEHLSRVFERFHRVPETRARSQEGAGIGLSLVEEIVRLHGGAISVVSKVGEGTTFTVSLPYGSDHLPAEQLGRGDAAATLGADPYVAEALRWLPSHAREGGSEAGALTTNAGEGLVAGLGSGGRVLVVDDNADMRDHLRSLLEPRWSVEVASNGFEALASARAEPPDAVLTDVMMPRLDGVGLLQSLRADPRTAVIPVILLSARAGEEAVLEGLGSGADDYVPKPFSGTELVARLSAVIELSRARRARAAADAHLAAANEALRRAVMALTVVGEALGAALEDPPSFFSTVTRTIAGLLDARLVAFQKLEDGDTLALAGRSEEDPAVAARVWETPCHPDGPGLASEIVHRGRVFRASLAEPDPEAVAYRDVLEALGARDVVSVPWTAGGEKLGILSAYDSRAGSGFSDEDVWVLQVASLGAGLVWRCAQAETQRRVGQRQEAARLEQHAERMSELERVKSDFLNLAAHELRGPIAVARGYLSLLADGSVPAAPDPRGVNALRIVSEKLVAISDLVDQMLATARLEDPNLQLTTEKIELSSFVDEIAVAFRRSLRSSHRLVVAQASPGLIVHGDRQRLTTLLINLLDNAVKFSPDGGEIRIGCSSPADGRALITVQDEGIGIAADDIGLLFQRFGRLSDLRTNAIPGIGLGLYFAREIARLHGGELWVSSSPGQGSVFGVELPRGGSSAVAERLRPSARLDVDPRSHHQDKPAGTGTAAPLPVTHETSAEG
jgi:signal transduction histidine kinase/CheY-like chemotaxis protein